MQSQDITIALLIEVKHRLYDECLPRIHSCLDKLTDAQVWWRPNESSNSIGNLILHLNGNVRQWVLTGLGGKEDHRKRQQEFDERTQISKQQLWNTLNQTMQELTPVIDAVTAEDLLAKRAVQTFEETGMTILVHVTEHFSYHTGQIAWITKMLTAEDLGFYEGIKLE
jgi:uncharacterized damage-inducible protein DinB